MTDKPKGPGQWGQQQKHGVQKQQGGERPDTNQQVNRDNKVALSPSPGDDRTPDQTIGQIAYAENSGQREGRAGEPQASKLEPEKQGGIGGP